MKLFSSKPIPLTQKQDSPETPETKSSAGTRPRPSATAQQPTRTAQQRRPAPQHAAQRPARQTGAPAPRTAQRPPAQRGTVATAERPRRAPTEADAARFRAERREDLRSAAPPARGTPSRRGKRRRKRKSLARRLVTLMLTLAVLAGMYLTAVYSDIPFIAKWRTAYIETAMNTLNHKWLATAFIPQSVIDEVVANMEQARLEQVGVNSEWDNTSDDTETTTQHRNATLTDTTGMSQEEIDFFDLFWEVDVDSMLAYVKENPTVLRNGWSEIDINEAGLNDSGTSIYTVNDEQVLAINAHEEILIARVKGTSYRGVIAIAKDPSRLSLQAASTLGSTGQYAGTIAEAHNGILAFTGSGFADDGGTGNGGTLAGYCMCNGVSHGSHFGSGYKRLELRKDNRLYVVDSTAAVSADTTDAVEFSPAMIIDGELVVPKSGFTDLQPRACVGQSDYGEIIALLVEGRLTSSIGISVTDCAQIMLKHACAQAMNVDGGTSAMIWYDGEYIMHSSNPNLSCGRTLPNAFVYAKK